MRSVWFTHKIMSPTLRPADSAVLPSWMSDTKTPRPSSECFPSMIMMPRPWDPCQIEILEKILAVYTGLIDYFQKLTLRTVIVRTPLNLQYFSSRKSSKWTGNWVSGFTAISSKAPSLLFRCKVKNNVQNISTLFHTSKQWFDTLNKQDFWWLLTRSDDFVRAIQFHSPDGESK